MTYAPDSPGSTLRSGDASTEGQLPPPNGCTTDSCGFPGHRANPGGPGTVGIVGIDVTVEQARIKQVAD